MKKTDDMPLWVFLAFSAIEKRKEAIYLMWACVLFTIYCVPWSLLAADQAWVASIFLIEDWSWVAMMIPIVIWYWLSLRWVDRNNRWPS